LRGIRCRDGGDFIFFTSFDPGFNPLEATVKIGFQAADSLGRFGFHLGWQICLGFLDLSLHPLHLRHELVVYRELPCVCILPQGLHFTLQQLNLFAQSLDFVLTLCFLGPY
jgi:hypothetical protein